MIYFDNASTTEVSQIVFDKVADVMKYKFANPSSLYNIGLEAENEIKSSKDIICTQLKINNDELYFTSGGTEANNTIILGTAYAYERQGKNIITTEIEHPSVKQAFKHLEQNGFNVIYLKVNKKGYINAEQLISNINDETTIISIMHVNNEIGTVQNIEELSKLAKSKNSKVIFHSDCIQSFGKYKINTKNIDLITISGHKIHAPKGIGAFYIKNGTKIKPLIFGGGQQKGLRPGTENIYAIAGFGIAAQAAYNNIQKNFTHVLNIKNHLAEIRKLIDGVTINGDFENGSPYILNMSFEGIRGEVLLHALEEKEIYVSTGSACSSRQKKYTGTVAYLDNSKPENSLRFSFSENNNISETDTCIKALLQIIPTLRKYVYK